MHSKIQIAKCLHRSNGRILEMLLYKCTISERNERIQTHEKEDTRGKQWLCQQTSFPTKQLGSVRKHNGNSTTRVLLTFCTCGACRGSQHAPQVRFYFISFFNWSTFLCRSRPDNGIKLSNVSYVELLQFSFEVDTSKNLLNSQMT